PPFGIQRDWSRITACRIFFSTIVNSTVIEDYDRNWKVQPANRFNFHAIKTKCAIAFNANDFLARFNGCSDRISETDAHDTPSTGIKPVPRFKDVNDIPSNIKGIRSFTYKVGIGFLLDQLFNWSKSTLVSHW